MNVSSNVLNGGPSINGRRGWKFLKVIHRRQALRLLEAEAIHMPAWKMA